MATPLDVIVEWSHIPKGTLPVFLLDSGNVQTASIAHHKKEYMHLLRLTEKRPSKMYLAHIDYLVPYGSIGFSAYVEKHNLGNVPEAYLP